MFKNNKGFMLAEVVVTSTIVLTALVSLYTTFSKLNSNYNTRKNYYNIDGMYAIKGMINYSIETNKLNEILSDETTNFNKFYFIENANCNSPYLNDNYCSALVDLYGIQNMVIVSYKGNDKKSAVDLINPSNETFKDYIDFVKKYYNFNDNSKYNYLILVEYNTSDSKDLKYSSMGMW